MFYNNTYFKRLFNSTYFLSKEGVFLSKRKTYYKKLTPYLANDGYITIRLVINNKSSLFKVHRLLAILFISNKNNLPYVHHIDGNPLNNVISNLQWVSPRENSLAFKQHRLKGGLSSGIYARRFSKNGNVPYRKAIDFKTAIELLAPICHIGEQWLPISNYCLLYWISSKGRVCSFKNKNISKILVLADNGKGYKVVRLGTRILYVHRLVAQYFIPNYKKCAQVNHKDFNKENNAVENLEWVSQLDNHRHARVGGRIPSRAGIPQTERHIANAAKGHFKKVMQFDLQGNYLKTWESLRDIDIAFKGSFGNVGAAIHNTNGRKTAYGYIWKLK